MGFERGRGLAPRHQRVAASIEQEEFSLFSEPAAPPSRAPTELHQLQTTMAEQNRILATLAQARSSPSSF